MLTSEERAKVLRTFLNKFSQQFLDTIHMNSSKQEVLVFWLANLSEFLHMIKADRELQHLCGVDLQKRLMRMVEICFEFLVESCRVSIRSTIHLFLSGDITDELATKDLLSNLEEIVYLIRKCVLNSALTIQLFSQLFHFINMYIFNWLVTTQDGRFYLTKSFGVRLNQRLHFLNKWSEKQGLEQACECHMDRIQQAVNLLITSKTNDQIANLGSTCYKLNSLQVRYILENYIPDRFDEAQQISQELIEHVVAVAKNQADVMSEQDGTILQLEETQQLQLPFLFPQDAYLVDSLRGIPSHLMEFINGLQRKGICQIIPQNSDTWTGHMAQHFSASISPFPSVFPTNNNNGKNLDFNKQIIGEQNFHRNSPIEWHC